MNAPYPYERMTVAARIVGTLDVFRIDRTDRFRPLDERAQERLAELIDEYDATFTLEPVK